jgi:hypothetical protein
MSSYTISVTLYFSLQYFRRVTDVHKQWREPLFVSRKHRRPPPPPESRQDRGRSFMWSNCVSLYAADTISKTELVVWCGQIPASYCLLHTVMYNGIRHILVVLCLLQYQKIKKKKRIRKLLLRIHKVLSCSHEWMTDHFIPWNITMPPVSVHIELRITKRIFNFANIM